LQGFEPLSKKSSVYAGLRVQVPTNVLSNFGYLSG
jgi:hypothetical protein